MYSELPADARRTHPFHMIEEIKAQPAAVERSVALVESRGSSAIDSIDGASRVILTGCGTSFHGAEAGAWLFRAVAAREAYAFEAWDLLNYVDIGPSDAVVAVTHSGETVMTRRCLERASTAGAVTIAVTGFPESEGVRAASHVLPTGYNEEHSWAHTASHTAAVASLSALANRLAPADRMLDLGSLGDWVREALKLEEVSHRLAASAVLSETRGAPPQIVLVGAGPGFVIAKEAALKLQETCYLPARPYHLEEVLHGPLASVDESALLVLIVPGEKEAGRTAELAAAAGRLGIEPLVLCADRDAGAFEGCHRLIMPEVPEVLSPIPYVVPLQLFSYYLAVGKGLNPDLIGRDDERQRAARAAYE